MSDFSHLMGRVENPKEVDTLLAAKTYQFASQLSTNIVGTGKGKRSNNFKIIQSVHNGLFPIIVQEVDDCTSFGTAGCINGIKSIRAAQGKAAFGGFTSTEDIFGGSRNLIGRGQLGRQDGSLGIWCAEYVKIYGTLVRKPYGKIDLSKYSAQRALDWKFNSVPKVLLPFAEEHQIKEYTAVRSWDEFRDLLYNGYLISVASNRGFGRGRGAVQRDKDGFLTGNQSWPHEMYFVDMRDDNRPGGLLVNSWPKSWVEGPKGDDEIPDGTGWVDREIIERDMLSANDSFGYTDYEHYELQDLDWDLIKLMNEKLKDF